MQENTSSLRPLYRRTWLVVLAAVAAACMLLLVVLPFGISYGLQQWLANNGGEAVQLEDVDFNIFTGRASVTDLNVLVDGQSRLLIPRLELDVDWLPVLSRRIDARAVTLDGVEINIVQGADGSLRVGGISLPAGEEQSEETGGEVWGFGLEQLEIINTTVTYQSPDLKLVTHFVNLELGHLATWKTDPASLALNATVNDAPILTPASPSMTAIDENNTASTGDAVSAILGASYGPAISHNPAGVLIEEIDAPQVAVCRAVLAAPVSPAVSSVHQGAELSDSPPRVVINKTHTE